MRRIGDVFTSVQAMELERSPMFFCRGFAGSSPTCLSVLNYAYIRHAAGHIAHSARTGPIKVIIRFTLTTTAVINS